MTLQEKIKADMVQAMRDKNPVRVGVLRGLMASFTNELLAKKGGAGALSDEDTTAVVMRAIKQRRDSVEQFKKGGREDLVKSESDELAILEEYKPAFMPLEEIKAMAEKKKTEMGITDKSKVGQLVGALMKELKGKADGADVKTAVDSLFA